MHRLQCLWTTVIIGAAIVLTAMAERLPAAAIALANVGDAGNAADTRDAAHGGTAGCGAVAYPYQLGKYEVTNEQYCEFLNAQAKSSVHDLFNPAASSDPRAGIVRSGDEGSYQYAVKPDQGQQPVVFVTWTNAIRFVNWLQNGAESGSTETGTYTINSDGTITVPTASERANWSVAHYVLPTQDEWYKAAYYKGGSLNAGYNTYAFADGNAIVSDQPPGDLYPKHSGNVYKNDGIANSFNDGYAITGSTIEGNIDYLTNVGAYSSAESAYHTFDQSGNAFEWNESVFQNNPGKRVIRGGSWEKSQGDYAAASTPWGISPGLVGPDLGFRVGLVSPIPEPATALLLLSGLGAGAIPPVVLRRWRQSRR
jgi:formylglycine-generating enzyme